MPLPSDIDDTRPTRTEKVPRRDSGFIACIDGADLAQLIQMECMSGSTRVLRVDSQGRSGFLYLRDGRVVHAVAGNRLGEAAAVTMLEWTQGTITPCGRPWPAQDSIETSWQAILLQAAHAYDEASRGHALPPIENVVLFPDGAAKDLSRDDSDVVDPSSSNGGSDPMVMSSSDDRRSIPVGVRLDAKGHVLTGRGDTESLAPTAAYARRLASLVAEDLGLDRFHALDARMGSKRLLVFVDGEDVVAMEPEEGANVEPLLARLGLD
jgi:hypothetical protein